jgi:arylsulfatase I/J
VVDLWKNVERVEGPARGQNNSANCTQAHEQGCVYEDEIFAEGVLRLIAAHNASTPLFLFWAPHSVHAPLEVPQAYLDKFSFIRDSQRQYYAAMVNFIDTQIGRVVDALKAKGMWDNLLWMSSSDNGGPIYSSGSAGANNWPLRGGKMGNFQGGIRVNAYASGGFLPAAVRGTTVTGLIETADMYTTFCGIAGVDATDARAAAAGLPPVDGFNMWPMISGANLTSPRTEVPVGANASEVNLSSYYNGTVVQGLVTTAAPGGGLWKMLIGEVQQNIWTGPQYPNASTSWVDNPERCGIPSDPVVGKGGCLFDLLNDPTEHNDVAAAHPDIVAALYARINYWQSTVFSPNRGTDDGAACRAATNNWGGFYGPFTA